MTKIMKDCNGEVMTGDQVEIVREKKKKTVLTGMYTFRNLEKKDM
ncbi:MAG: hypothetical protein ACLU6Y_08800 [Ruminococcus sp.]